MGDINSNVFDDLFGDVTARISKEKDKPINQINVRSLHPFEDHPFKIKMDENFETLKKSIELYGVTEPIIARPRKNDIGLEIISGHRRWTAAKQLKLETVPVITVEADDDLATIMMVMGNQKREKLDPSEMAKLFKKLVDAETRYSRKNGGGRVTEKVGSLFGMKARNVHNYIKLMDLIPEMLELVDNKELKVIVATFLSELEPDQQRLIVECYNKTDMLPNDTDIAKLLRDKCEFGMNELVAMLETAKVKQKEKNRYAKYDRFFPDDWTDEQKESAIEEALEMWQKHKSEVQI